ncbi:hypothetical protein NFC81_03115 [Salinispirillum sp. LH 10-3-1]|uniref:ATPase BadF/BadG/BcrA/BcrD type domain-containing protein n=1 Tax=Salinispirillum sp. LH 10-3-1 TaxID=2952525 RepID=A0AB38YHB3_9GAMM
MTENTQYPYYVGIDGGGTQCRARLIDHQGTVLAEATGGSANLYQHATGAIANIEATIRQAFQRANLPPELQQQTAVGMGLAGAELPESAAFVAQWQHPFAALKVQNDAHIACLGAHGGRDGGLVIVGTGIVGWAIVEQQPTMLDGWGFPLADQGSGAWLGLRAIQETLRATDGIRAHSSLTQRILAQFDHQPRNIPGWASTARSGDFGQFARWVVEARADADPLAVALMQEQAEAVGLIVQRLADMNVQRIALLGGLGPFVGTELVSHLRPLIVPAQQDALAGALLMIKQEA